MTALDLCTVGDCQTYIDARAELAAMREERDRLREALEIVDGIISGSSPDAIYGANLELLNCRIAIKTTRDIVKAALAAADRDAEEERCQSVEGSSAGGEGTSGGSTSSKDPTAEWRVRDTRAADAGNSISLPAELEARLREIAFSWSRREWPPESAAEAERILRDVIRSAVAPLAADLAEARDLYVETEERRSVALSRMDKAEADLAAAVKERDEMRDSLSCELCEKPCGHVTDSIGWLVCGFCFSDRTDGIADALKVVKAAKVWRAKYETVRKAIDDRFAFAQIHGMKYEGPNYGDELRDLDDQLAAYDARNKEPAP